MDNFVKSFIKDNKPQVEKYKKYFKENDWSIPVLNKDTEGNISTSKYYYVKDVKVKQKGAYVLLHEGKESEYKIQAKIVKTIVDRLKHFHSVVESDIGKSKSVDNMVDKMVDLIECHLKRVDNYIRNSDSLELKQTSDSSEKTEKDFQSEDIEFDNLLYGDKSDISDKINKLDLNQDKEHSLLELHGNSKAPLAMRDAVEAEYPHIKEYVKTLGIDFDSPPKNEMLIHVKNPPVWNPDKHYFEQDKKNTTILC